MEINTLQSLAYLFFGKAIDPKQGGLFDKPKAPLHQEVKIVHDKTGKTHQQRYYVKTEPAPPITPPVSPNRVTGKNLTLMTVMQRFQTVEAARAYFEKIRWPDGPVCPHCGGVHAAAIMPNLKKRIRPGLYQCTDCNEQFTVTVGTVMEASHIPLNKWLIAFYMMCASKTQVAALQLQRQLELGSYSTALFMCHRIRIALADIFPEDKLKGTVEVDETYIGGKAHLYDKMKNKTPVVSMVERGGRVRSKVVDKVTGLLMLKMLDENVDDSAHLNTDESSVYRSSCFDFASHDTVNHSMKEYSRDDLATGRKATTNTVEGYFGNTKNSIRGTHHAISPQHTELYLAELDYKYNTRKESDGERTVGGIEKIEGKRLKKKEMYDRRKQMNQPMNKAVNAHDDLTMPEDEFDSIMRQAMQQPAPAPKFTAPVAKAVPLYLGGLEQPKEEPVAKGKPLRLNFYRHLEKPKDEPVITAAMICGLKVKK